MSLDLNVTEGDPFVEVCVEIVVGTVSEEGTVEVETISGTATGKLDYDVQQSLDMVTKCNLFNCLEITTLVSHPNYHYYTECNACKFYPIQHNIISSVNLAQEVVSDSLIFQ